MFPGTEQKLFNDAFFQAQDIVVNALDNVEARRYVDGYGCVVKMCSVVVGVVPIKAHVSHL